jgi:hypothetical protein
MNQTRRIEDLRERIRSERAPASVFAETAPDKGDLAVGQLWFDCLNATAYTKDEDDRLISWSVTIT